MRKFLSPGSLGLLFYIACIVAGLVSLYCIRAQGAERAVETEDGTNWDALSLTVLAEEQVIDLPKDGQKWFISVVGVADSMQYKSILRRFEQNKNLKSLKSQVHFWAVPTTSPAYKARYEAKIKELPTIRVQQSDGKIVWEAAGKGIPMTAGGLYSAIKSASMSSMALLPWRRNGTVLPWRNKMEGDCGPKPCPVPDLVPVPNDPEPAPLDDGGPPVFEEEENLEGWKVACLAALAAMTGGGYGAVKKWKAKFNPE